MMIVTFLKAEPGIAIGDKRAVPDRVAKELVASGIATAAPFPPEDVSPILSRVTEAPRRITLSLGRKARKG